MAKKKLVDFKTLWGMSFECDQCEHVMYCNNDVGASQEFCPFWASLEDALNIVNIECSCCCAGITEYLETGEREIQTPNDPDVCRDDGGMSKYAGFDCGGCEFELCCYYERKPDCIYANNQWERDHHGIEGYNKPHWTREPPTEPGTYKVVDMREHDPEICYQVVTKKDLLLFAHTIECMCPRCSSWMSDGVFTHWWSEPERLPPLPEEVE